MRMCSLCNEEKPNLLYQKKHHQIRGGRLYILTSPQLYWGGNWGPAWLKSQAQWKANLASRLVPTWEASTASALPPTGSELTPEGCSAAMIRPVLQLRSFPQLPSLLPRRAWGLLQNFSARALLYSVAERGQHWKSKNLSSNIAFDSDEPYELGWVIYVSKFQFSLHEVEIIATWPAV